MKAQVLIYRDLLRHMQTIKYKQLTYKTLVVLLRHQTIQGNQLQSLEHA